MDFTLANEMTDEQIAELMAGSRDRGVYPTLIKDFVASDKKAINVAPNFEGKKLVSVAAGIRAAVKKSDAPVKVICKEIDKVEYLALVKQ